MIGAALAVSSKPATERPSPQYRGLPCRADGAIEITAESRGKNEQRGADAFDGIDDQARAKVCATAVLDPCFGAKSIPSGPADNDAVEHAPSQEPADQCGRSKKNLRACRKA